MLDINDPAIVDIEIRPDGKMVWIHISGTTEVRINRIGALLLTDRRILPNELDADREEQT